MKPFTFYLIALLVFGLVGYIVSINNTIFAAFALILVYILSTFLLIALGIDFLPLLFVIVYVGAITVLFLFVIMMLNIKEPVQLITSQTIPLAIFIPLVFTGLVLYLTQDDLPPILNESDFIFSKELGYLQETKLKNGEYSYKYGSAVSSFSTIPENIDFNQISDIHTIGLVLYSNYSLHFLLGGIVLLVGLVGSVALVLHLREKRIALKQDTQLQLARNAKNAIILVKYD